MPTVQNSTRALDGCNEQGICLVLEYEVHHLVLVFEPLNLCLSRQLLQSSLYVSLITHVINGT